MLTFTHPGLLWGGLALAVPIVLHLLNRRPPRRLLFPTIRFLQISELPREGKRRLHDLLLLCCRLLLLGFLILGLAGPRWQAPPLPPLLSVETGTAVILLDASVSMRAGGRAAAARLLLLEQRQVLSGWNCTLLTFDRQVHQTLPAEAGLAAWRDWAAGWEPGWLAGEPLAALRQAGAFLARAEGKKRLVVISDFQRSNWSGEPPVWPEEWELQLLPADAEGASAMAGNAAVSAVQTQALSGGRLRVQVTVRNMSAVPQERMLTVELGVERLRQPVALAPLGTQRLHAVFTPPAGGELQGRAGLDPDAYAADDNYLFWGGELPPVPVLVIVPDVEPESAAGQAELFFLQQALLAEQSGRNSGYALTVQASSSVFATDYQAYQIVILAGSAERLAAGEGERLRAYRQAGGLLVHFPGPAPAAGLQYLQLAGLLNCRENGVTGSLSRDKTLGLGWINPDSLLARLFTAEQPGDLFLFRIRKHLRLQPGAGLMVHLKSLEGAPMLIEESGAGGSTISFAWGLGLEWSDLPLSQSFLPVVRELCSVAMDENRRIRRFACGDRLPVVGLVDGRPVDLNTLVDSRQPAAALAGGVPLEINPSPSESAPETIPADDLRRFLQRGPASASGFGVAVASPVDDRLARLAYVLAALFLLAEALLLTRRHGIQG